MRKNHYTRLLKLYHSTLSATLRKLGTDPDKYFTWEDLQNQMKACGMFAVVLCPISIQLRLATPEDCTNLDEISRGDLKDFDLITGFTGERQVIYNKTINDLLRDLTELEYVS